MNAARVAAAGLAFVGGFSDAYGFLRFGAFGANMTGNTVIFAISLFGDAERAFMSGLLIILFFCGSILGRAIAERFAADSALYGETALLVVAALVPGYAALGLISFAMGMQNTALGTFAGVQANTSFVTGDYAKLAQALADLMLRRGIDESRPAILVLLPLIAAYASGALVAVLFDGLPLALLIVAPIVLVVAYAVSRKLLSQ